MLNPPRVAASAHDDVARLRLHLQWRIVDIQPHVVYSSVTDVADDSDDRPPRPLWWRLVVGQHEPLPEGALSGPQPSGRARAHECHRRRICGVAVGKQASLEQRDTHGAEITGRRTLEVQSRILPRRFQDDGLPVENDAGFLSDRAERERAEVHGSGSLDVRQPFDASQEFRHPLIDAGGSMSRRHIQDDDVGRDEAEIDALQVDEAPDDEALPSSYASVIPASPAPRITTRVPDTRPVRSKGAWAGVASRPRPVMVS
jgi:hypothetical protein